MTWNFASPHGQLRNLTPASIAAAAALLGSLFLASGANSQPAASASEGDPAAGRVYAQGICAQCHNISGPTAQPDSKSHAPSFYAVANAKTTSVIGLNAFLMTSHPTMPNLIIAAEDRRNVIAYILTLRRSKKSDAVGL